MTGQVKDIRARSTTILTNDNIAIIVPNSDFIEKPVINWSHGDPRVRFRIPLDISIDSDVTKARKILTSALFVMSLRRSAKLSALQSKTQNSR